MALCDAGPLIALISNKDAEQRRICAETFRSISEPLVTTWVCFGEAMHLLGGKNGLFRQLLLWEYVERDILSFYHLTQTDSERMKELMIKYQDHPMDLGDASLVVAAEVLNIHRIFTLDKHFRSYVINGKSPFDVIP